MRLRVVPDVEIAMLVMDTPVNSGHSARYSDMPDALAHLCHAMHGWLRTLL